MREVVCTDTPCIVTQTNIKSSPRRNQATFKLKMGHGQVPVNHLRMFLLSRITVSLKQKLLSAFGFVSSLGNFPIRSILIKWKTIHCLCILYKQHTVVYYLGTHRS